MSSQVSAQMLQTLSHTVTITLINKKKVVKRFSVGSLAQLRNAICKVAEREGFLNPKFLVEHDDGNEEVESAIEDEEEWKGVVESHLLENPKKSVPIIVAIRHQEIVGESKTEGKLSDLPALPVDETNRQALEVKLYELQDLVKACKHKPTAFDGIDQKRELNQLEHNIRDFLVATFKDTLQKCIIGQSAWVRPMADGKFSETKWIAACISSFEKKQVTFDNGSTLPWPKYNEVLMCGKQWCEIGWFPAVANSLSFTFHLVKTLGKLLENKPENKFDLTHLPS